MRRIGIRDDTYQRSDFEEYTLQHFRSWYTFANDRLRRGVKPGQILIVTSCDKTAEWATAAFATKGRNTRISFSGGLPAAVNGELALGGAWERNTSVQHRTGPLCGDEIKYDQTVFIRGYRVRERTLLAPKVIKPPGRQDSVHEDNIQLDVRTTEDATGQLEASVDEDAVCSVFRLFKFRTQCRCMAFRITILWMRSSSTSLRFVPPYVQFLWPT